MESETRDLEIYSNWKTHPSDASCKMPSKIMLSYSYEWIIQGSILLVYLSVALGAKVEGCPRGYLGPGGISEGGKYFNCTGGIHRWLDIHVFGYNQIYHHPTCKELYNCIAYDPEGLLGSLSACTLCYLGTYTISLSSSLSSLLLSSLLSLSKRFDVWQGFNSF